MYNITSKYPASFTHGFSVVHQASEKDGQKLSPVDLPIARATTIQLPPLTWNLYDTIPTSMSANNSGFTVMINAKYKKETPFVSSGPLTDDYRFYHIHFHWGEHNGTGSGHAVNGIRYPLEMHVVHIKKGCANLEEALECQDGIVEMVHLFALRESRNTQLDQLTAILQFIQKYKSCARLYPVPLSDLVHPFTSDYFLYWGAVATPKGYVRILWFVSCKVLPISTKQLEEFRQIRDPQGKLLMLNSSKPLPLDGRSLFLVSPSRLTNDIKYDVTHQPAETVQVYKFPDVRNAEYNSLADLGEACHENCRVCPYPYLKQIANINVGFPIQINEGDTSIEESCTSLENKSDDDVTIKTEMTYKGSDRGQKMVTDLNVTARRQMFKPKYDVSKTVSSVASAKGSEILLKQKRFYVTLSESSTEEGCVLLHYQSVPRLTSSAPSLSDTREGYLTTKPDQNSIPHLLAENISSELVVYNDKFKYRADKERMNKITDNKTCPLKSFALNEIVNKSNNFKKVKIQQFGIIDKERNVAVKNTASTCQINKHQQSNAKGSEFTESQALSHKFNQDSINNNRNFHMDGHQDLQNKHIMNQRDTNHKYLCEGTEQESTESSSLQSGTDDTILAKGYYYSNKRRDNYQNKNISNISNEKYFICSDKREVSQSISNSTCNDINVTCKCQYTEKDNSFHKTSEEDSILDKEINFKSKNQNKSKKRNTNLHELVKKENTGIKRGLRNRPSYRVKLVVCATVSDHKRAKKEKEKSTKIYYVTKVPPVDKSSSVILTPSRTNIEESIQNPTSQDNKNLFYAEPMRDCQQIRSPQKDIALQTKIVNIHNNTKKKLQYYYSNKTNNYGNFPDEDFYKVDKTIIGKMGKNESVEVFVKKKHIDLINTQKDNTTNEVFLKFMKIKQPKPKQCIVELHKHSQDLFLEREIIMDQDVKNYTKETPSEKLYEKIKTEIPEYNIVNHPNNDKQNDHKKDESLLRDSMENYEDSPSDPLVFQNLIMPVIEKSSTENLENNRADSGTKINKNVSSSILGIDEKDINQTRISCENINDSLVRIVYKTTHIKNNKQHEKKSEICIEHVFEESTVHTSERVHETKITQITNEICCKFPVKNKIKHNKTEVQHTIIIKKIEIPEPHFFIKMPKQSLVEYEAFSVQPDNQFLIISETAGKTNETIATKNKTFKLFKKVKEKIISNSSVEPLTYEVANTRQYLNQNDKSYENPTNFIEQTTNKISSLNEKIPVDKEQNFIKIKIKKDEIKETEEKQDCDRVNTLDMGFMGYQDKNGQSINIENRMTLINDRNEIQMSKQNFSELIEASQHLDKSEYYITKKVTHQLNQQNQLRRSQSEISIAQIPSQEYFHITLKETKNEPATITINMDKKLTEKPSESNIHSETEEQKSSETKYAFKELASSHKNKTPDSSSDEGNSNDGEEKLVNSVHYNLTQTSQPEIRLRNPNAESKSTPNPEADLVSLDNINDGLKLTNSKCCSPTDITNQGVSTEDKLLDTNIKTVDASTSHNKPSNHLDLNGLNQSPVKIETKLAKLKEYPKLNFINHWNAEGEALLENNGKTLRVTFLEYAEHPYIHGGPLTGEYEFHELHFHWGPKDCCGAEHIIDGERYPIEGHFMYFKKEYENLQKAMEYIDGVAIIAVMLNVGSPPNPLLEEFIRDIPLIQDPNTGIYIPAWSMFAWMRTSVTEAKGYFSYKGLLTSQPPHVENVTWVVFPDPIPCCCQQSRIFRKLKSTSGEVLRRNFRHPQPLNSRLMYYVNNE